MSSRSTAKKSLQSFHARTVLWKVFELRAAELECSIDYLINEAMRHYAMTNDFLEGGGEEGSWQQEAPVQARATAQQPLQQTVPSRGQRGVPTLPRPSGRMTAPAPPSRPPPPIPRPGSAPGSAPSVPRPTGSDAMMENPPNLTLIFQGRKYPIASAQFIIGRGSKSSDLPIKDANISRKHAAVIYHNGAFYIKDLGSTNGIEYKGKQVDSKRIDEGDVFSICGYELHFTYSV